MKQFTLTLLTTIICAVLVLWYLFKYFEWRRKFLIPLEKLPGPKRYPVVGTLYPFIGVPKKDLFHIFENYIRVMPPLFRSWNGSLPEINVRKPEHIELIMGNPAHSAKGDVYKYFLPWLGEGLILSKGSKWHKHRKLITPTFHFKILENYLAVFQEKTLILLEQLEKKIDTGYFDISVNLTHCTMDIICETAMGVTINVMQNSDSEYVKSIYGICDLVIWRALRPYIGDTLFRFLPQGRTYEKYRKILHNFSYKVIAERKEYLRKNNIMLANGTVNGKSRRRLSFLDLLLEVSENGSVLSDEDIREEVDTFMFAGHDTITANLSWVIFLLGNNTHIQDEVFLELQEVLGDKRMPTTIEELSRLRYLERVIKETLRLYPSVPGVARIIGEDLFIDGYKVPKGVQALVHIYQVHRDPKYFPDPEKFDPDRFLPENSERRHPYCYIPFSAGPRNCMGQKFAMNEAKMLLAAIVKNFEIISQETPATIPVFADIIFRPMNGVSVQLTKRHYM